MLVRKCKDGRYLVKISVTEEALFQREVDSRPAFVVVDITTFINYVLDTEIDLLKIRYSKCL